MVIKKATVETTATIDLKSGAIKNVADFDDESFFKLSSKVNRRECEVNGIVIQIGVRRNGEQYVAEPAKLERIRKMHS